MTSAVYDRMPVILDPDSHDLWLDPGMKDVTTASDLLKPSDAPQMRCYPVSTRINHVANDDEECSRPIEFAENQAGYSGEDAFMTGVHEYRPFTPYGFIPCQPSCSAAQSGSCHAKYQQASLSAHGVR